ncbi:7858_t:CDS:2, partial [Entrophospora sp. SA101]
KQSLDLKNRYRPAISSSLNPNRKPSPPNNKNNTGDDDLAKNYPSKRYSTLANSRPKLEDHAKMENDYTANDVENKKEESAKEQSYENKSKGIKDYSKEIANITTSSTESIDKLKSEDDDLKVTEDNKGNTKENT